MTHISDAN